MATLRAGFFADRGGNFVWAVVAGLVLISLAIPSFLNPYYLRILIIGLLYAYLASCWNFIGGYAGQMSLGNAIFFGIGSYMVALFANYDIAPTVVALPAAILVAGALAKILAAICFRYSLRGIYFAVGTLLLAEIVRILVINTSYLGRSQGLQVTARPGILNLQFANDVPFFYLILFLCVIIVLGSLWLERSKLGFEMVALREQESAAQALGVATDRIKQTAFVISAMLTSIGGFVYGALIGFVEPAHDLSLAITMIMVMGAVLGGRGTALGPIVGGLIVMLVQETLTAMGSWIGTTSISALAQMFYGLFFVLVILFFPRGIVGQWIRHLADRKTAAPAFNLPARPKAG